ncbi:MAG TPA: NAD-dependent epimerase/dehydratase family protein [Candidatus Atribacteria bacterium]|mgnify:CR=1 FL=1|nr:NAD-dependent epimerase/dehydratase family protein [Candidatus Atribacteria bacterium]
MSLYSSSIVREDISDIISRDIDWEMLRGRTVLITGASGMLASYLVYVLMHLNESRNMDIKVLALVRNAEKARLKFADFLSGKNFKLIRQDISDPVNCDCDIDYIVHAAGNASPKYILSDPVGIIKANTLGTMNVLELALQKKVKNVLFTSTREVYGRMPDGTEEILESDYGSLDCKELRSCYPESKRLAETMLESYFYQYKVPYTTARIAHSYGPGMDINEDGRVMSDFISDVVNGRDIVLKSDGKAERAFCYISDAVAGMFTVLLHGKPGEAYNIANESEPVMIKDAANTLVELFADRGLKVVFEIPEEKSKGYSRMGRVRLNTQKLESLGWSCRVRLRDGLYRTVVSFLSTSE